MTNSHSLIALLSAILLGGALTGCASAPGNLPGLGSDGMSMVVVHKDPFYGPETTQDAQITAVLVNGCLKDVQHQQAGVLEVMATNAGVDAADGFVGGAGSEASEAAYLGVHLISKAIPAVGIATAVNNAAQGMGNGLKIKSNAVTNIVGPCANGDLHDPLVAAKAPGMHVYGSSIRTNNSSKGLLPTGVVRLNYFKNQPTPGDTSNPDDH
jgi:hypothetical protein